MAGVGEICIVDSRRLGSGVVQLPPSSTFHHSVERQASLQSACLRRSSGFATLPNFHETLLSVSFPPDDNLLFSASSSDLFMWLLQWQKLLVFHLCARGLLTENHLWLASHRRRTNVSLYDLYARPPSPLDESVTTLRSLHESAELLAPKQQPALRVSPS